ncbi:MAG: DRTGG domain-containing protein [bacterium]
MNLREIKEILGAEVLTNNVDFNREIKYVVAADLMSDVLNNNAPAELLLTGLTNSQTIRTCEIAGISAVVFVRGKKPDIKTIRLAEECNIPILCSELSLFDACGILYAKGIKSPVK